MLWRAGKPSKTTFSKAIAPNVLRVQEVATEGSDLGGAKGGTLYSLLCEVFGLLLLLFAIINYFFIFFAFIQTYKKNGQ